MFDVWTKGFKDFFLVFLVLGLVNGLLGTLLAFALFGVFVNPSSGIVPSLTGLPSTNLVTLILFVILAAISGVIINSIVTGGMAYYSVRRFRGEAITLEAALRKGLEKFLSIFGANFLLSILVFAVILVPLLLLLPLAFAGGTIDPTSAIATICGALVLLVVGGVIALYLSVAMSLYAPAIMFEDTNAVGGLARSWRLTKGHWWSLFGAIVVAGFLGGIHHVRDRDPRLVLPKSHRERRGVRGRSGDRGCVVHHCLRGRVRPHRPPTQVRRSRVLPGACDGSSSSGAPGPAATAPRPTRPSSGPMRS